MKKDQLSWEEFYKESQSRSSLPKKISEFNRLVAHTKNFFVISGYGAFTPGYLLIISKDFLPSFGLIKDEQLNNLEYFSEPKDVKQIKINNRSEALAQEVVENQNLNHLLILIFSSLVLIYFFEKRVFENR